MTRRHVMRLNGFNQFVIEKNIEGMSHEESLSRPGQGGSCPNWVLGHIVASRDLALQLLGRDPIWSREQAAPYLRGTDPVTHATARRFEQIVDDLRSSHRTIMAALEGAPDETLTASARQGATPVDQPGDTIGDQLIGLCFHESYHGGQLGVLRRVAGKPGAIS